MSDELLTRIRGWRCPVNDRETFATLLGLPHFDAEGYERTQRINGIAQCPDCGLWWPLIEDVEAWTQSPTIRGRWLRSEWGPGTAECLDCGVVIVSSFDGAIVFRP